MKITDHISFLYEHADLSLTDRIYYKTHFPVFWLKYIFFFIFFFIFMCPTAHSVIFHLYQAELGENWSFGENCKNIPY